MLFEGDSCPNQQRCLDWVSACVVLHHMILGYGDEWTETDNKNLSKRSNALDSANFVVETQSESESDSSDIED